MRRGIIGISINYFDFALEEGKAITAAVAPSGGNSVYSISDGGITHPVNETHHFNDAPKYTIETYIEGEGFVTQGGIYNSGDAVAITSCPLEGYVFKGWYIDGCLVSLNPIYSFTAKGNVEVVGRFDLYVEPQYDDEYSVTVTNGSGDGDYEEGETVTITANPAPTGQRFKQWNISPSVTFAESTNATSATAKFMMPAEAVTATAVYEDNTVATYALTVVSGSGSGSYSAGTTGDHHCKCGPQWEDI